MRRVLLGVLALGLMGAGTPQNQPMEPKVRAYTLSLMCYVVAVHDQKEADTTRNLDAVRKMGKVLGYTDKRVSDDIWTMTNVVGDQIRRDPNSINVRRDTCRKVQLAS